MANNKTLPDIKGTDTIAGSWRRLLERDRNISTLFSGDTFTTGQTSTDVGKPNWRTDLRRLFIWDGTKFVNLFTLIEPYEIGYEINHPDVPSTVNDVKGILDLLVRRNELNTLTLPAESVLYTADGSTSEYNLSRSTVNKSTLLVFIDGVKQASDTFDLSSGGDKIVFKAIPSANEIIEIIQHASLLEWDFSPVIVYATGDGSTKTFTFGTDGLSSAIVSVNVDGKELQKNKFSVNGSRVTLATAPVSGASIQIMSLGKTSFVTVSPASIGTEELKNKSVTADKLADNIPVNINSIPSGSITNSLIANQAVTANKLADNSVNTNKVVNKSITKNKLADSVLSDYYTKAEVDALIAGLRAEILGE